MIRPTDYDTWRLIPPDRPDPPGTDLGDVCGRYAEPDDDAPRGFRPKPCDGEMVEDGGVLICDTCGEVAE